MSRTILWLYIRALEKFVDFPSIQSKTNAQPEWLSTAWKHTGFREYVAKRNDALIYEAAGGAAMKPKDNLEYTLLIGRRVENLQLSAAAKKAHELEEKRRRKKHSSNKPTVDTLTN